MSASIVRGLPWANSDLWDVAYENYQEWYLPEHWEPRVINNKLRRHRGPDIPASGLFTGTNSITVWLDSLRVWLSTTLLLRGLRRRRTKRRMKLAKLYPAHHQGLSESGLPYRGLLVKLSLFLTLYDAGRSACKDANAVRVY